MQLLTKHAPAVFALALAFFLGGSPRCRASSVPASLRLSFRLPASFLPPPAPGPLCPALTGTSTFQFRLRLRMARLCPAPVSHRPPGSPCLFCAARLPFAFSCLTARLFSPHALPCHRYLASAAGRAPPPARHGRPARLVYLLHACTACGLLGAPPAACLPLLTSCTFSRASHPAALGRKQ